jgi:hypothetical protein
MRVKAVILVALLVVVTAGCAVGAGESSAGACPAPLYGIITDGDYKIISVEPGSSAEEAGLQAGDVLVDATWSTWTPIICNDVVYLDSNGSPLLPLGIFAAPVSQAEPAHPSGPVPFTDQAGIKTLLQHYAALKFRVQRGDQMIEVIVTPGYYPHDYSKATPTPMVGNYHYF